MDNGIVVIQILTAGYPLGQFNQYGAKESLQANINRKEMEEKRT